MDNTGDFMKFLENFFDCSGFCTETKHYMFSDVNRSDSIKGNCRDKLNDFIETFSNIVYLVSLGISIYLFVNVNFNIFRLF